MAKDGNLSDLQSLRPDPLEPRSEEVERYVARLQTVSGDNPELARREVWEQIRLAGARTGARRHEVRDSLNRIFRLGSPPEPAPDGFYRGLFVTMTIARPVDALVRGIGSLWMPWVGKRFDAKSATGENIVVAAARVPTKLIWPGYHLNDVGGGLLAGFRFDNHVAPGHLDPDRQVFKIDYDRDDNPGFLVRDVVDEIVQVVPGAYLGKFLTRRGDASAARWRLAGYFGLQSPQTVRDAEPSLAALVQTPSPAST